MLRSDQIRMRRYGPILLSVLLLFGLVCPALCALQTGHHHGCCEGAGQTSSPMLCPGALAQSAVRPSAPLQRVPTWSAVILASTPYPDISRPRIKPPERFSPVAFRPVLPPIVLRI